jgi:hypothetical protein
MIQRTALALCIGAIALIAAAPAAAAPSLKIFSWHVYTNDGMLHKVKPGDTFTTCNSNPTTEIDAKGNVTGANKGGKFDEKWTVDGHPAKTFHSTWDRSGNFVDYWGIGGNGFEVVTGKWKVRLVKGTNTIGKASITLAGDSGC